MNRKGQALVEFVLILPVFIMILFVIFDFGNIISTKNQLENDSTDIVRLIRNGASENEIETSYDNIDITISSYEESYQKVSVSTHVALITPFLDKILGNPYTIEVERVIPDDKT